MIFSPSRSTASASRSVSAWAAICANSASPASIPGRREPGFHKQRTLMKAQKFPKNTVQLVASGDLRLSANQTCWPAQHAMEQALAEALHEEGWAITRCHAY